VIEMTCDLLDGGFLIAWVHGENTFTSFGRDFRAKDSFWLTHFVMS